MNLFTWNQFCAFPARCKWGHNYDFVTLQLSSNCEFMTLWLYPWQMAEVTNKKLEFHCMKQLGWKSRTHKDTPGIQKALMMLSMSFFFLFLLLSSVSGAAKEECTGSCCWLSLFLGFSSYKNHPSQYFTLPDHLNFCITCTILLRAWWEGVWECWFNLRAFSNSFLVV